MRLGLGLFPSSNGMFRSPIRASVSALATFALGLPGVAQDDVFSDVPLPSTLTAANVATRSESGRFTGDGRRALVHLAGESVLVVLAPLVYEASAPLDSTGAHAFLDVAVMPQSNAGRDRLFTLGNCGLTEWTFSTTTGVFKAATIDSALVNAHRLSVGDFNGDDVYDLAYVTSNGNEFAIRSGDGSAGFDPAVIYSFNKPIVGMTPVRWNGFQDSLAVVADSMRLYIRSGASSIASYDATGTQHVALQAFGTAGTEAEALIWITADDDELGTQRMRRVSPAGMVQSLYLGAAGVALDGLTRGDVDGDGSDDMTMTFATIPNVVTLFNRPELPLQFAASEFVTYAYAEYGYDTVLQSAQPTHG